MKCKYLIIILLSTLLLSSCFRIPQELDENLKSYVKVATLDYSEEKLYVLANKWFVETFVHAESVIHYSDKEAGVIMGKFYFDCKKSNYYGLVSISVQGNECKIELKYLNYRLLYRDDLWQVEMSDKYLLQVQECFKGFSNDFFTYLEKGDSWID